MTFLNPLPDTRKLGLDAPPLIYFVEEYPAYIAWLIPIFRAIDTGSLTAAVSTVALTEVLTKPYKDGNTGLIAEYRARLLTGTLRTVPVSRRIANRAAELRARYDLRTPDALQLATALLSGCDAFLTNDFKLRRVTELRVLLLSDLAAS